MALGSEVVQSVVVDEVGNVLFKTYRAMTPREAQLAEALRTLVEKLDAVHADPRFQAVWTSYMVHGGRYTEPRYDKELSAAKAALTDALAGEEPTK